MRHEIGTKALGGWLAAVALCGCQGQLSIDDRRMVMFEDEFEREDSDDVGNGWIEGHADEGQSDWAIEDGLLVRAHLHDHGPRIFREVGAITDGTFSGRYRHHGPEQIAMFLIDSDGDSYVDTDQPDFPDVGLGFYTSFGGWDRGDRRGSGNIGASEIGLIFGDGVVKTDFAHDDRVVHEFEFELRVGSAVSHPGNTVELYLWDPDIDQTPEEPILVATDPCDTSGTDVVIYNAHDGYPFELDWIRVREQRRTRPDLPTNGVNRGTFAA